MASAILLPRLCSTACPAAKTFFNQSDFSPYPMSTTKPSRVGKTNSGVRYRFPDLRPTCSSVPRAGSQGVIDRAAGLVIRLLNFATALGIRISASNRDAPWRSAVVAHPETFGAARRSVGVLRRVHDAGWPPDAEQSQRRDPAHVACGFRQIPPFWRFRRRARAAIAVTPAPAPCRGHRSRRHHCIRRPCARAGAGSANVSRPWTPLARATIAQ